MHWGFVRSFNVLLLPCRNQAISFIAVCLNSSVLNVAVSLIVTAVKLMVKQNCIVNIFVDFSLLISVTFVGIVVKVFKFNIVVHSLNNGFSVSFNEYYYSEDRSCALNKVNAFSKEVKVKTNSRFIMHKRSLVLHSKCLKMLRQADDVLHEF